MSRKTLLNSAFMTFFGWSMHFSLNGHYTSIKTQSNKLERVNILKSDILKIELEETTLSNSGQTAHLDYLMSRKSLLNSALMTFFGWSMHFSPNDHYTSIKTQSNKLERVNFLNSDIIKFELEETTLKNSRKKLLAFLFHFKFSVNPGWLSSVHSYIHIKLLYVLKDICKSFSVLVKTFLLSNHNP